MKKEFVTYKSDSFTDFKGVVHHFTVCTISKRADGEFTEYEDELEKYFEFSKVLSFGVAICNPLDQYDQKRGESMAYHRALEGNFKIVTTRPGIINQKTVDALMNDYIEFIKRDPGSIIKGYEESRKKWNRKQELIAEIGTMDEVEIYKYESIAKATPEDVKYAKEIMKLLN